MIVGIMIIIIIFFVTLSFMLNVMIHIFVDVLLYYAGNIHIPC